MKVKSLSSVRPFATPWTIAHQAPPSMGFSSKNTGVGCHFLLSNSWQPHGLPGSSVYAISQARLLERVAISFCLTLGDLMDCQAPLSMQFPRQDYWCRLPFPTPGDLPNPGIEPKSLAIPTLTGRFFTTEPPGKPQKFICLN